MNWRKKESLSVRNFCLYAGLFRRRKRFKEFTDKISGTDIVAGTQVAVILLACRELCKCMIVIISGNASASIKSKSACFPCTDCCNPYAEEMRLLLYFLTDDSVIPHRQSLRLTASFLAPLEIQMLHYDSIYGMLGCKFYDCG